ncbi:CDP-alcohol phosphatidyltransferase family protein [bacterium]|nr:CDP-alcohol phosphatidyltransferase family protein [bacterium]
MFLRLETWTGDILAVVVMVAAAVTDFFDGLLARKLDQKSDLGRVLDPIADKICVVVTAFLLIGLRDLPLWYFVLLVARDLGILVLGSLLVLKTQVMVESNWMGKVAVTAVAVVLVVFTLRVEIVKWPFLWISVALLAASTVSYLVKSIALIKRS